MFTAYPSIVADPGEEAVFPLTVDSPESERVDLALGEAPEGFEPTFRGGGSIVRSVYTGGQAAPELELSIAVPDAAQPGDHRIVVTATAPSGSVELPIDVVVADLSAGDVSLTAEFPALRGDSEDTFSFDLDLANDTSQDIDFALEGQAPEGWVVEVQPSTQQQAATTQVAAGDSESVQATVTPPFQVAGRGVPGPRPGGRRRPRGRSRAVGRGHRLVRDGPHDARRAAEHERRGRQQHAVPDDRREHRLGPAQRRSRSTPRRPVTGR